MAYGNIMGQRPNLSGYVTTEQLNQILANYVTHTSLSSQLGNYVTNNALNTQLDNYLELSGGTMTGQLDMGSQKIINVPNGVNNGDAVNFEQLNNLIDTMIPFANSGLTFVKRVTGRANGQSVDTGTSGTLCCYSFITSYANGVTAFSGTAYCVSGNIAKVYYPNTTGNMTLFGTFASGSSGLVFNSNNASNYYYDFFIYLLLIIF